MLNHSTLVQRFWTGRWGVACWGEIFKPFLGWRVELKTKLDSTLWISKISPLVCSPHTSKQLTAITACKIRLRNATVAESHQTSFTWRRQTVKIFYQLNDWLEKCKSYVRSMVKVLSITPRPQINTFSRDTVPLRCIHSKSERILEMYCSTLFINRFDK